MNSPANDGRGARLAKINSILAILVLFAVALSAWAYHDSVRRAERFERGQDFLPNLNPDEVAAIKLTKGDQAVSMRRDGERFVIVSEGRYPASNESVNRLLRDMLGLSLERRVGAGAELAAELGLGDAAENMLEVALQDAAGKDMVSFRVGDSTEGGGSYVTRTGAGTDGAIYLTSNRVFLSTDGAGFLDKDLVDEPSSRVVSVKAADYTLARPETGGGLELADLPAGKSTKRTEIDQIGGLLTGLRFDQHLQADAPEVAGLVFEPPVEIVLDDGSGYRLELASRDDKHYLRISGFHTAGRLEVSMDASEEEVRETSEVLVRADQMTAFNRLHGSWIYAIPSFTADKLKLRRSDLIEP